MRRPLTSSFILSLLVQSLLAAAALGQRWSEEFARLAPEGTVHALFAGSLGGGERLWVGGHFTSVDDLSAGPVVEWNGRGWRALPGLAGEVRALTVFDDGAGPALYAGGALGALGGVARWDGAEWAPLGLGVPGTVHALAVWNDGSGRALYVGGEFAAAGGAPAANLARWDGGAWAAVGAGVQGAVYALRAFTGGDGDLYIGGAFPAPAGGSANITRWDGAAFAPVGAGADGLVRALEVYDDGGGPRMYAGGGFALPARYLASWGGGAWRAEAQLVRAVDGLRAAPFRGREWLAIGGSATAPYRPVALWDGRELVVTPVLERYSARAMAVFDDGGGRALHAASGGRLARLGEDRWQELGAGVMPYDPGSIAGPHVRTFGIVPTEEGERLIVGGSFVVGSTYSPPTEATSIAAWDGRGWEAFRGNLPPPGCIDCPHTVLSITPFAHDGKQHVYVMGLFYVDGVRQALARSDGGPWQVVPEPLHACYPNPVFCIFISGGAALAYDDGGGPALFCASDVYRAGSLEANGIARWDGAAWSTLGDGLRRAGGSYGSARALAIFDDGRGPALYAAGEFDLAGGLGAANIARWDGASWAAVGSPPIGTVRALEVFDDGRGEALFAGGHAAAVGGNTLLRWDGAEWSAVGGGVNGRVYGLFAAEAPPIGPALYVGGDFTRAGGIPSRAIAKWIADRCHADLDGSGGLDFFDFLEFQTLFAAGDPRADFTGDGLLDFFDYLAFEGEFAAACD